MQFLGNHETRALYLNSELHNFEQGDFSITDHCRKLKGMANTLSDLGEHVSDCTLVLNLIRGLNERFEPMRLYFKRAQPFPNFLQARNDLLLEELTISKRTAPTAASAFVASTVPASGSTTTLATAPLGPDALSRPTTTRANAAAAANPAPVVLFKLLGAPKPGHLTGTPGRGPSRCGQGRAPIPCSLPSLVLLDSGSRPWSPAVDTGVLRLQLPRTAPLL
ncbi:hypothetical protein U9M48_019440 [Paspalum notatum var. saurae]|uniref:Uncharacterized protein n=1 Tax=Paspalum notatum var. saurae TaxID=547442 RepID=A0AAQ3TCB8_PASNO